jgi:hypothetical protein
MSVVMAAETVKARIEDMVMSAEIKGDGRGLFQTGPQPMAHAEMVKAGMKE